MLVVGFDLETGSAKHMHRWDRPDPYVVLAGAVHHRKVAFPAVDQLIRLLNEADLIYGHNILGFDIPALVTHYDAPWSLMDKAVDTLVWARHVDPPAPKGMVPVRYDLTSVAERLKVPTKTDDVKRLAERALKAHIRQQTAHLHDRLADLTAQRKALKRGATEEREKIKAETVRINRQLRETSTQIKAEHRDIGGFHLIAPDDPDLVSYLHGDLIASEAVFHQMRHLVEDPYCQREMAITRRLQKMAHSGWRVNTQLLSTRVQEEDQAVTDAKHELARLCPGLDPSYENPVRTTAGLAAIERGLKDAGCPHHHLPRTDTGKLATAREALGTNDWVHTVSHTRKQWSTRTQSWTERTRKEMIREPGLQARYPHNQRLRQVCELSVMVGGKVRKYRELAEHADVQGRVFSSIGQIQVSGRFGMVSPSITNIGKRGVRQLAQREVFVARNPDEVLVSVDLDQGDMRVVAALSQDPAYMALFEPGKDAHMENAFLVFGERTPKARKAVKPIGHGANYGMGVDSCVANSGQPREIVQRYFDVQEEHFPILMQWKEQARREARTGLIKDNGWGRPMRALKVASYTQGPALYGQSGTREILMDGVLRLPGEVADMMVAIVHDEIVFSVPRSRVQEVVATACEAVETTWRGVAFTCGVNGPSDNWGACYADD